MADSPQRFPFEPWERPTLRKLGPWRGLQVGAAVAVNPLRNDPTYREFLVREFNVVTAENAMKFYTIRRSPERYDFSGADAIVTFAQDHGLKVRGHTLVWHFALPEWLSEKTMSREETIEFKREYIHTVVGRYRGRVFAWDVVNEAIEYDGSMRQTYWYERLGPDYVDLAFQWAREADPEALLFYNDFVGEGMGHDTTVLYDYVKGLLERGVPVDGVGLQLHVNIDDPPRPRTVRRAIRRFADLGLKVHITELDVSIAKPVTAKDLDKQARIYADLIRLARNEDAVTDFIMWGFTDRYSWVPMFFEGRGAALPFDEDFNPKPAHLTMMDALASRW